MRELPYMSDHSILANRHPRLYISTIPKINLTPVTNSECNPPMIIIIEDLIMTVLIEDLIMTVLIEDLIMTVLIEDLIMTVLI